MRRGMRPFYVQKPKFSEDDPEAAIREGADELTLRAEEVTTLKACINIDHIEDGRWGPPLADAGWHASATQFTKELKGRAVLSLQRDEQGSRSQKAK